MTDYIIGIDGGGSKTDFLLCDLSLNEIARRIDSRSNPNDIGIEAVIDLVCKNISALLCEADIEACRVKAVFAGIAGLTTADYQSKIIRAIGDMLPDAKVDASHDGINVLYGAFPQGDGVSIICGTGSSCFVKKGKEIIRIGGYGSFDLVGNGYEIGRAGIAHALKTIDGRAEESPISLLLKKRLGEDDLLKALDKLLLMTKNELASFATVVFEAAEMNDESALEIIKANMEYIAGLIKRAGDYFEGEYSVAIAGSVAKNAISQSFLRSMLEERVLLVISENAPSFGAAAKARTL